MPLEGLLHLGVHVHYLSCGPCSDRASNLRCRTQLDSAAVVIDWRIHYASVSCMLQCLIGFSITKERTEVVFKGTYAQNPNDPKAEWLEYEFKCKPGAYE